MPPRYRQASGTLEWTVFLACSAISLVLLLTSPKPGVRELKDSAADVVSYAVSPLHFVRRLFSIWTDYDILQQHAVALSKENAKLRDALVENLRLRAMLDMRERENLTTVSASVVSAVGPALGGQFRIDQGSSAGIKLNAAVITPLGLVGKTVEVTNNTALIQTLVGNSYGVAVMLERTRMRGILRWSGPDRFTLTGLPQGVDVKSGDLVLTSGAGSVFPKGLRVGVVNDAPSNITTYGESWQVQPFVDFRAVEDVFVIVDAGWPDSLAGKDDIPVEAQQ
ncbi:MAG: rod shape-determining protein MreC [Calditrichaeota bacterium]|nr:rod shape-determining protein MreC [Calditrichota bacterium]MCB9368693.1 rod shape-determining protein MreC [Calditrichota bacterium]